MGSYLFNDYSTILTNDSTRFNNNNFFFVFFFFIVFPFFDYFFCLFSLLSLTCFSLSRFSLNAISNVTRVVLSHSLSASHHHLNSSLSKRLRRDSLYTLLSHTQETAKCQHHTKPRNPDTRNKLKSNRTELESHCRARIARM